MLAHEAVIALGAANLPLLTTIAAAFAAAWVLGLITQRLGLSPILGYLLAGVVIGPHTPGFVGDVELAQQLAEIGVILLMFAVGLHFKLKDLMAVRAVAIPGALGQSALATAATVGTFWLFGWSLSAGLMLGIAASVASTVVLLRVLMDRGMLSTTHGHVAVGWLIMEDVMTVLALVMVPIVAALMAGGGEAGAMSTSEALASIGWAIGKLAVLVAIVLLAGSRVVPWVLDRVARLRSPELFTLTVLVLSIAIAVGSAVVFGASVALGAFLAGMVVAQSPTSHQAASDALPMRDAFAVIFFVSVGMLFDPGFVVEQPWMTLSGVAIVMVVKPIAAIALVAMCGHPPRTALTVALGLAQIGEFSFIMAQAAREHSLMPAEGTNILVATAMISITLNPLVFGQIDRIEGWLRARPRVWRVLNARHERRVATILAAPEPPRDERPLAVIVGYGPVGRLVDALLRDGGLRTVVIDTNITTVQGLVRAGRGAVYGDATRREVLEHAGIREAAYLIITLPHTESRSHLVLVARELSKTVEITVRARYLSEREPLVSAGASRVIFEEGEAGLALARDVLSRRGADAATVERLLGAVRKVWRME